MSERESTIQKAAVSVMSRYGLSKTTMADIAAEAGVSRQTLYNAYANKEEVVRAAVRSLGMTAIADFVAACATASSLEDKIDAFFRVGPLCWYDMVAESPDMADIVEGLHKMAQDEMADLARRWTATIETELAGQLGSTNDAQAMADFIYSTAANAKIGAENRQALEQRLDLLKRAVLGLAGNA